jgi:hypothetical protein
MIEKTLKLSAALWLGAGLVACGSGGSDGPSPSEQRAAAEARANDPSIPGPSDKYIGTWLRCSLLAAPASGKNSVQEKLVITKKGPARYKFAGGQFEFASADCSGTPSPVAGPDSPEEHTIQGEKLVDGLAVELITSVAASAQNAGLEKNIAYVNASNSQLQGGDMLRDKDANGYPNHLDPAPFTKQP